MFGKRYKLEIWLDKVMISIPFDNKEELYMFMFSLHSMNSVLIYMVWDVEYNHLLDVMTPKEDD